MKVFLLSILVTSVMSTKLIFDFNNKSSLKSWTIVNDVVMGGRSSSTIALSKNGHGVFKGNVSLENYGGFASVRHNFKPKAINGASKVVLRVKGDGKNYQFRIKHKANDYHSYVATFKTNGDWQEISIPLSSMYPSFRGRRLNKPNFKYSSLQEIAFLIANKKQEGFRLIIDKIELK